MTCLKGARAPFRSVLVTCSCALMGVGDVHVYEPGHSSIHCSLLVASRAWHTLFRKQPASRAARRVLHTSTHVRLAIFVVGVNSPVPSAQSVKSDVSWHRTREFCQLWCRSPLAHIVLVSFIPAPLSVIIYLRTWSCCIILVNYEI